MNPNEESPAETLNEADTCRLYVTPRLQAAGWETLPRVLTEQYTFTAGRIIVKGNKAKRREAKRADYLLRYTRDFPLAVVEAKAEELPAAQGIEQAKDYALILGLSFAYATNGKEIIEFDFLRGTETRIADYPTPDELWRRLVAAGKVNADTAQTLLSPSYLQIGKEPRYYQEIAINAVLNALLAGQKRVLLTLATGTGKTQVAFQIAWKLWSQRWNREKAHRRPRILFLADRNILVDDPHKDDFAPFDSARHVIAGKAELGRDIYFATYQSLGDREGVGGLYREFPPDFFDLIIIDEAHRGSARDDSSWRSILKHFAAAYQFGMTATPLRQDSRDTYLYFGNPVYTYSLKQGIDDGFLAPYCVYRVLTVYDEVGYRPRPDERDRYGNLIPDEQYKTKDFEKRLVLEARTKAIARHLSDFLRETNRFDKTIVFCADQEHALDMRQALVNENSDLAKEYPNYVCRVTSDEGDIGKGYLETFQDIEAKTPVILTTSQLLTTGVNAPTCRNVVLVRPIDSMVEFKQIIGRGTRVREDYGKLFFNILDYAGSASERFADPAFDGEPALLTEIEINAQGEQTAAQNIEVKETAGGETASPGTEAGGAETELETETDEPGGYTVAPPGRKRTKYYVDGGQTSIASVIVQELDADGNVLRVHSLTDYTADKVRTLYATPKDMAESWGDPERRQEIIAQLKARDLDADEVAETLKMPDADPFDVLCHLAYNAPLLTRRQRADQLKSNKPGFFNSYAPTARAILDALLDKYAEHGAAQFKIPDALKMPPISTMGTPKEIIKMFGGTDNLKGAVRQLETLLYEVK